MASTDKCPGCGDAACSQKREEAIEKLAEILKSDEKLDEKLRWAKDSSWILEKKNAHCLWVEVFDPEVKKSRDLLREKAEAEHDKLACPICGTFDKPLCQQWCEGCICPECGTCHEKWIPEDVTLPRCILEDLPVSCECSECGGLTCPECDATSCTCDESSYEDSDLGPRH